MLTWLEKSNKGGREMGTDVHDVERASESEKVGAKKDNLRRVKSWNQHCEVDRAEWTVSKK